MAEMKDSGIEWCGKIPISWNVMPNKYSNMIDVKPPNNTCHTKSISYVNILLYCEMIIPTIKASMNIVQCVQPRHKISKPQYIKPDTMPMLVNCSIFCSSFCIFVI